MTHFLKPNAAVAVETASIVAMALNGLEKTKKVFQRALLETSVNEVGKRRSTDWMPINLFGVYPATEVVFSGTNVFGESKGSLGRVMDLVQGACHVTSSSNLSNDCAELHLRTAGEITKTPILEALIKRTDAPNQRVVAALVQQGHMSPKTTVQLRAAPKGYSLPQEIKEEVASSMHLAVAAEISLKFSEGVGRGEGEMAGVGFSAG